jgi:hypothetical protein
VFANGGKINSCKLKHPENVLVKFIDSGVVLNEVNFTYVKYKQFANVLV